MNLVRILVDSLADQGLTNAQMTNAREIVRRLDPDRFHVSVFSEGRPDRALEQRPNTRLVHLPSRRRTVRIFREFVLGRHEILFYVKSSPASRLYMGLRKRWQDNRITIGTVESQSDLRNEPTITPEAVDLWERTVLRCDYLFSNAGSVKRSLQREYNLPSEIVPTGVDTSFFTPAWERPANPRPIVLFVGSLRPFKQPQLLLEAAARFPGADFVLVGEGLMGNELKERIERERLGNVRLAGLLQAEELKQQYQLADIFLFPSTWEGSPKVLLEAAACGLPVIARNNYQPETVVDGETGYLCASNDELFGRLGEMLGSPRAAAEIWRSGPQAQREVRLGTHRPALARSVSGSDVAEDSGPRRMTAAGSSVAEVLTPKQPLHVLTLTPFYPVSGDDGQGCFVAEPLAELARLGVANTVRAVRPFYRGGAAAGDSAVPARWVRFFSLPGGWGLSTSGAFLFARLLADVRRLHASHPVHVIHAHSALPCGHAALLLSRELKIPFVVTVHGLDAFSSRQVEGRAGEWCARISQSVYRSACSVICVSEKVRDQVVAGRRPAGELRGHL